MPSQLITRVQSGFADAMSYDAYRPSYPEESVRKLLEELKVLGSHKACILDLGAGTGKLTEQLVAQSEEYEIIAVDPHPEMLDVLVQKRLPRVRALEETASNLVEVGTGWVDAVVVGQAFHWFANMESLREIYRVLKPKGSLGLIWNLEDYNSDSNWKCTTIWENKLKNLITHRNYHGHRRWQDLFEEEQFQVQSSVGQRPAELLFSLPIGKYILPWTTWMSKDAIWNRFKTLSLVAVLDTDGQEEMKRMVFDIMKSDDVLVNNQDEIALHGRTEIFWIVKHD